MFYFPLDVNENFRQVIVLKNFLTSDECQTIIKSFPPDEEAKVDKAEKIEQIRKSKVSFIGHEHFINLKLANIVNSINETHYHFNLSGILEPVQVARYDDGDFYQVHTDHGEGVYQHRKISCVVQLSNFQNYKGGELFFPLIKKVAPVEQGTLIIFPSYVPHQVLKVEKGVRHSLACWVSGPNFK